MRIYEVIWKDRFVEKLESTHHIATEEVEVDEDVMKALKKQARKRGVSSSQLASELLRRQI